MRGNGWFGCGVALLLGTTPPAALSTTVPPTTVSPTAVSVGGVDSFPLQPATGYAGASGRVALRRVWSPFEVTVTPDGFLGLDAVVTVNDLPPPGPGHSYVAWLATPTLDQVRRLGVVANGASLTARVEWNQFLVVVTLEAGRPGARWTGPTVLHGRSRSALIQPLWGHSLFQRVPF